MGNYYTKKHGHYIDGEFLSVACVGAALVMLVSLSRCGKTDNRTEIENNEEYGERIFQPGEHIIAVSIDDPTSENKVYPYHEGYKPVGISAGHYGRYTESNSNAFIMYSNNAKVKALPTKKDVNDELVYDDFGTVINKDDVLSSDPNDNEYLPGEHIISVPLYEYTDTMQIPYYDGYEAIGIATTAYGSLSDNYGNGCILYVNVDTVEVKQTEDEVLIGSPKGSQRARK